MDFFSHFLIGIMISIFSLKSFSFSIVIYAAVMSVLADFDIFLEPLRLIKNSPFLSHKGLSHSYFFSLVISFFTGLIFSSITGEPLFLAWIIGFFFYNLHITLDFLAASKIPILYPFSKKRYRFFIDRAINPILALISGIIFLLYIIIFFTLPELYFSNLIYYVLSFYVLYFIYRVITKLWVQARLPNNSLYIPGILLFSYLIYENQSEQNQQTFKLFKKLQFSSKKTLLLKSEIKFNSVEMDLYNKARAISKSYLFFSKWKFIVPIIKIDEKSVNVILILAESYASNRAYALNMTFDSVSNKLINIIEGFNNKL